ncbi:hypothetical protein ACJBTR_10485, partial [Streptococcus suis]
VAAGAPRAPLAAPGEEPGSAMALARMQRKLVIVNQIPGRKRPRLYRMNVATVVTNRADPHDQAGGLLVPTLRSGGAVQAGEGGHNQ